MTSEICDQWQKQRKEDKEEQDMRDKRRDRRENFLILCIMVSCGIQITGLVGVLA